MDLLDALGRILKGDKFDARVMADWIEDNKSHHPEFARYHALLLQPETLRLQTVIDVIVKFGPKKQRSQAMKIIRLALRSKHRPHSKGVCKAFMKKGWSLQRPWFMAERIGQILGTGAATDPSDSEGGQSCIDSPLPF